MRIIFKFKSMLQDIALILLTLGLSMACVAGDTVKYTVQTLPFYRSSSGSGGFFPFFLNDGGQIAGTNNLVDNQGVAKGQRAFLWRNNQRIDLGTLGTDLNGFGKSVVTALNDKGQVVGYSTVYDQSGNLIGEHGFLWTDGVMQDLGSLGLNRKGQDASSAVAINANGQVLLNRTSGFDLSRSYEEAFLWGNGRLTQLDGMVDARAINASGQVAGTINVLNAYGRSIQHAAVWSDGRLDDLGLPVGFDDSLSYGTGATLLNDAGQVGGELDLAGENWRPGILWSNGIMDYVAGNYDRVSPIALNSKGEMGGQTATFEGRVDGRYAFIYSGQLGFKILPLLGYCDDPFWDSGTFGGMNNAGFVVGASTRGGKSTTGSGNCSLPGTRAYIYHSDGVNNPGVTVDLNTLIPAEADRFFFDALTINNAGQILVSGNRGLALLNPVVQAPKACDANSDGNVNISDLGLIYATIPRANLNAPTFNPAYDIDGDGKISVNDVRKCVLQCTKTNCAA